MRLGLELDREVDGRWIAEVVDLPGVSVALRVVADQLEHGESPAVPLDLSFVVNAA